jgi:hypothetical protein
MADLVEWNADHARDHGIVWLPVLSERNATSEVGAAPQDVINRQLVDDADRIDGGWLFARLGPLVANWLDLPDADYADFRRVAELLFELGQQDILMMWFVARRMR